MLSRARPSSSCRASTRCRPIEQVVERAPAPAVGAGRERPGGARPGSAGSPRDRATRRSPKAATSAAKASSVTSMPWGAIARGYAAEVGACHHAAHGDQLPRRRDHGDRQPVPARDGPGPHPRRLRHVPGRPQRGDPQPRPARLRAGRARRDPAHPRPPRPLRADPRRRPGGLPGPDPGDRRRRSSWRGSCCWTPGGSRRSSPSARRAGSGGTPRRPPPRIASPGADQAAIDEAEEGEDGGERGRRPAEAGEHVATASPSRARRAPEHLAARPRGRLRAQPPTSTSTSTSRCTRRTTVAALRRFPPIRLRARRRWRPGSTPRSSMPGHILGSAIIRLRRRRARRRRAGDRLLG